MSYATCLDLRRGQLMMRAGHKAFQAERWGMKAESSPGAQDSPHASG